MASFGLVALVTVAAWLYNPLSENPSSQALSAPARNYDVEIIRDNWGVPHIVGERDADVSFGLAYAHAEDDFATIQETVAATRGVLARYRGSAAAPTDYIVSLLGVWHTIDDRYAKDVPEDVKAIAKAYAAGLNLYAARNPDSTWRGLAPFKAQDIVAGFVFKAPFFYGLDKVLLNLFDDKRKAEIALAPTANNLAWQVQAASTTELGSNAMAVNAKRSGDETTRLLINSHQPMTGPVAWYEAHLISQQGLDIYGGLFPGTPLVLHGFNRKLGWANTVNHIDLSDTYVLNRNPENDMLYHLDGQWLDFEQEQVTIMVKLIGPFMYPAKRRVLRSQHGPVIEGPDKSYALRYTGMDEIRQLEQYYRLDQASNQQEFLAAMALNALPSINYIYADSDDNIAFIHNAQYPARDDAWDWSKDLPGDRSELIWQGYRPFSDMPKLINPESGMLFNANNTPFSATDGSDNLSPDDFPQSMGLAHNHTNRSLRLIELNDGHALLDRQAILRQKFDLVYSDKSEQLRTVTELLAVDYGDDESLVQAANHLSQWDHSTDKENRHTALAILTLRKLARAEDPDDHSPAALRAALESTIEYLITRHGRIDPPWGEVNRLIRGDVNVPIDGGPDILRAIYSFGLEQNEPAYATHGDTWMALVEWDKNGQISADVLHQFGSATLDKSSPHYADQAQLFADKKWRKALLNINEIRASSERSYFPIER